MPRGARLDTPGTLHHVILRGIGRQKIRRQLVGDDLMEKARKLINESCAKHNLSIDVLRSGSRRQAVSALRGQLALKLVNVIGLPLAETGRQLGLTTSGVAQVLRRKS